MRILRLVLALILALSICCACGRIRVKTSESESSADPTPGILSSTIAVSTPTTSSFESITPTPSSVLSESIYTTLSNDITIVKVGLSTSYNEKEQELFRNICKEIDGTWLNEEYIKNIKSKDYLFNNVRLPSSIEIYYQQDQKQYCWSAFYGEESKTGYFDSIKIEHQSQKFLLTLNDKEENVKVEISKNGIENFYYNDLLFDKIDCSEDEYINQYMLVGSYKDQDGKSYIFNENAVAVWPDRSFKYTFWLSCFCTKNTIAFQKEEGNQNLSEYAFDFRDGKIYFYETIGEGITSSVNNKPFLVLEKVSE